MWLIGALYFYCIGERKAVLPHAFFLGLCVYGTFSSTNFVVLIDWSFFTMVSDTLWGGVLYAAVTALTYKIFGVDDVPLVHEFGKKDNEEVTQEVGGVAHGGRGVEQEGVGAGARV